VKGEKRGSRSLPTASNHLHKEWGRHAGGIATREKEAQKLSGKRHALPGAHHTKIREKAIPARNYLLSWTGLAETIKKKQDRPVGLSRGGKGKKTIVYGGGDEAALDCKGN